MKRGFQQFTRVFLPVALLPYLGQTTLHAQSVNVLTQHNDNARTGANLSETQLNTSNVSSDGFGMLFSLKVDGQIYAQPLFVSNLRFRNTRSPIVAGTLHNVAYVATMHNSVYAFDADNPSAPLWAKSLGTSVGYEFMPMVPARIVGVWNTIKSIGCGTLKAATIVPHNIWPEIGITSTPVIDLSSQTIYVVPKTTESDGSFAYWLHALDLLTGNERPGSPVKIEAHVAGKAKDSFDGTLTFNPMMHLQRPGLLLANGKVYIAFGAHQDTPYYHGWILAYDAKTLTQSNAFSTTPDGDEGGIWQSGNGLASDSSGNIYLMTGNGKFDGGPDFGDSFIKLSPNLAVLDWFTPSDFKNMDSNDSDLGSAGPLLLPGSSLLVGGGKYGRFYLLNRNDMGHLEKTIGPPPLQKFMASRGPDPIINNCDFDYHHIHGSPVTWNSPRDGRLVYIWAERDRLKAFQFDSAKMQFSPTSPVYQSTMEDPNSPGGVFATKFMPGGILSISANGSAAATGILWASLPWGGDALADLRPGILRAFDAANVGNALWCGSVGTFAKFNPPTIANGKVYLGTFDNHLNVYANGAHKEPKFPGGYKTHSGPFVYEDYVYFQGVDDALWKVYRDGTGGTVLGGGFKTKSSPFVSNGYAYFQGTDDKLWKVNISDPTHDQTNLGGLKTSSSPFVDKDYVYFQGKDDTLWRVYRDGTGRTNPAGFQTKSTPFTSNGYMYFQGTDDKLWKVSVTNPVHDQTNLGKFKTNSSPFVSNGYAYFQGTDDKLWKVSITNPTGDNTNLSGLKTKSSPFVAANYVYFRGTDDALWRVYTDGTGLASPGCGNSTKATPFVYGDSIFFRGTDDRLLMVWAKE